MPTSNLRLATLFASTLAASSFLIACGDEATPDDASSGGTVGTGDSGSGGASDGSSLAAGGGSAGGASSGGSSSGGSPADGGSNSGGTTTSSGGEGPDGTGGGSAAGGGASPGSGGETAPGSGGTTNEGSGGAVEPGTPSSGCSLSEVTTGDSIDGTITVGSRERSYRLSVPTDYVPGEPLPLVFGLNGVGGDGKGAQSSFGLESGHRGLFVYPDSIYKESSGTEDWEYSGSGYDVDFFDALVAELNENYCVDTDRIFSVGVSAGGIMSNMLGCFRGDVLRGIAPASAMTWGNSCTGEVAVMVICGETDDFNPCDVDAAEEIDIWTKENGCGSESLPSPIDDICSEYQGCAADAPVLLCKHPGGHMWPGAASDFAWNFFMGL